MSRIELAAIWAQDKNRVIGVDGGIPWHIPGDFRHFRDTTMGSPLVMGRKTFESLPGVLEGREHIVISRQVNKLEGATLTRTIDEALFEAEDCAMNNESSTIWVIGGSEIFEKILPLINRLVVTEIDSDYSNKDALETVYAPKIPKDFTIFSQTPWMNDLWRVAEYHRKD